MRLLVVISETLARKPNNAPSKAGYSWILPYFLALSSLLLGSSIYLLSRDTSNLLYQASTFVGASPTVDSIRGLIPVLPNWLVYSLPDGLWMFSFSILILSIWGFQRSGGAIVWISTALAIGVLMEFFQALSILPGQFDWLDLVAISIAAILALCFTYK